MSSRSLEFMHNMKMLMVMQMKVGDAEHGRYDPFTDKQNLSQKAMEEAADSGNYDIMESQKVVCQYDMTPESKEHLLQMLDNIAAASLLLGVQWCEYEAALQERLMKERIQNEQSNN